MTGRRRKQYVYRWWDGPTYRQETFPTKREKDEFVSEIRRRRRLGLPLHFEAYEAAPTLDAFVEDFWRLHAVPNLEASTRTTYAQQWAKWIHPRLGSYQLDQLTPKLIVRQLVDPMRRAGAQPPTINAVLAVLQSILRLAVDEERLPVNPISRIRRAPTQVVRQVPAIPAPTIERLRARLDRRDATIVSVLAYAGLRPQELLALQCEDLGERAIAIRRKDVDGELLPYTKTRRNRMVKLLGPLAQDLAEWRLASGVRRGLLFANRDGDPWTRSQWATWRENVFQPAARAVDLPDPRPYDLRAAFVSLLAWEGYTMLEVANQAGHSVAVCEKHYAKVFEDVDPANRVTAEEAIRAARQPGVAGVARLFDVAGGPS